MVVGLVFLSLVLVTLSFRTTALDPVEGFAASVLRPFEIGANRVARPFRDTVRWTNGLFDAKQENEKLRAEIARLKRRNAALIGAKGENDVLHKLVNYIRSPSFPKDFTEVAAQVLTSPSTFDQSVTISAGSNQGIAVEDVVVTSEGLVGTISRVFANEARVTLITAPLSAVRAVDGNSLAAVGILEHGNGGSSLLLDRVGKDKSVVPGDTIVTAGSPSGGDLPSLFPRGIPIGSVISVSQSDTAIFKSILVEPFADLSALETVLVLIPKEAPVKAGKGGKAGTR